MVYETGKLALISFFTAIITFTYCEYAVCNNWVIKFISDLQSCNAHFWHLPNYIISRLFIKLIFKNSLNQVAHRSFFLGYTFSFGVLLYLTAKPSWKIFGIYTTVMSTFHLTEFLAIAFTNPAAVSIKSFFINHSTAYTVAAILSWIEFLIERYCFLFMKQNFFITFIGILLCFFGEIMRKLAIFTAKRNFNHVVQVKKASHHTLVTHGVYAICRHPSYCGWFYWSIGTQLILQNPICFIFYAIMSWRFFNERVVAEEISLIRFFGPSYIDYQKKVRTGLPFIDGYTELSNE